MCLLKQKWPRLVLYLIPNSFSLNFFNSYQDSKSSSLAGSLPPLPLPPVQGGLSDGSTQLFHLSHLLPFPLLRASLGHITSCVCPSLLVPPALPPSHTHRCQAHLLGTGTLSPSSPPFYLSSPANPCSASSGVLFIPGPALSPHILLPAVPPDMLAFPLSVPVRSA